MCRYEYACTRCKARWEQRRPMELRDEPAVCPHCRTPTGKRCFTPTLNLFYPPFTGRYTRGEIARAVAPETEEEKRIWKEYG